MSIYRVGRSGNSLTFLLLIVVCLCSTASADNNDQISEATTVLLGDTTSGTIATIQDVDIFAIDLPANELVRITKSPLSTRLQLFDPAGNFIQQMFNPDLITVPVAGTYFVGISHSGHGGYNPISGDGDPASNTSVNIDYSFRFFVIPPDLDDQFSEAQAMQSGTTVSGTVTWDVDVDMYSIVVPAGKRLRVANDSGYALRVFRSSGQQIGNPHPYGSSQQLIPITAAGTYYVGVSSPVNYDYNPQTGENDTLSPALRNVAYQLTVDTLEPDDDNQIEEATTIAIADGTSGTIDQYTDVDFYAVQLQADTGLRISASDHRLAAHVFDAEGNRLSANNNFSTQTVDILETGTYYIGISLDDVINYDPVTGGGTGIADHDTNIDYELVLVELPSDDDDTFDEATPIAIGDSKQGNIDNLIDVDMYSVSVTQPSELRFAIAEPGYGVNFRVFDSTGTMIGPARSYDDVFVFDAAPGTYYLGVNSTANSQYDPITGRGDSSSTYPLPPADYEVAVTLAPYFLVNSYRDIGDNNRGDGVAWTGNFLPDGRPETTLRAAIQEANLFPDVSKQVLIGFRFDGPGPHVIRPRFAWPSILGGVRIDGFDLAPDSESLGYSSDPGPRATPVIEIDGSLAGSANAFSLSGVSNSINGLAIYNFDGTAVDVEGHSHAITDCIIGTNANQDIGLGNQDGVRFHDSDRCWVYQCQISGNFGTGVRLSSLNDRARIQRSYIGTDDSGNLPLSNGGNGIAIFDISMESEIEHNTISANTRNGIFLSGQSVAGTQIRFNEIGVTMNRFHKMGNASNGIFVKDAEFSKIESNLIGGNTRSGILISGATARWNQIISNIIGSYYRTSNSTVRRLGNGEHGVCITNGARNTIGGTSSSFYTFLENVICENGGDGIRISGPNATANRVFDNRIGCLSRSTIPAGNKGDGIALLNKSNESYLRDNHIGNNQKSGIAILDSDDNTIQKNIIGWCWDDESDQWHSAGNLFFGIRLLSSGNVIGGETLAFGNYLAGNKHAVVLAQPGCSFNFVENNRIGYAPSQSSVGDREHTFGVFIANGAHDNVISKNQISHCASAIRISNSAGSANPLSQNRTWSNSGTTVDTGPSGANPPGLNNPQFLQNAPTLVSSAVLTGDDLQVTYKIEPDEAPEAFPISVEFFHSSGGEARSYRGIDSYNMDDWIAGEKTIVISGGASGIAEDDVTATATNTFGNTSELAEPVAP